MNATAQHFLRRAETFAAILDSAGGRWDRPTPCEGWSVRDVVAHVIDTERDFLQRQGYDMGEAPALTDPAAAWRSHAAAVAEVLAADGVIAWFQGRSEFGPRGLGHRSLLADPRSHTNLEKLNDIKGREQFRPIAPMVLAERAHEIFTGPIPSPYMLFTHGVREGWAERIRAVVHVDGTARIQTVHRETEPLVAEMLEAFEALTGVPVVVNTSLNTAGRPMVDDPRDALECFGSAPVDALAIGPFIVRRPTSAAARGVTAESVPA